MLKKAIEVNKEIEQLDAAVDVYATEMKKVLRQKAIQGYRGWNDAKLMDSILEDLVSQVEQKKAGVRGRCIHISNLAMVLHRFEEEERDGADPVHRG
jgi:hypothetical protein